METVMINVLEQYALDNGWSSSMYYIVENDIKNGVFQTVEQLRTYIAS